MQFTFDVFKNIRPFFKNYIQKNTLDDLNNIPKGFNNNMIWNIGHVVVTTQILTYKLSGLSMHVSEAMVNAYSKGSQPKPPVTQDEVNHISDLLFTTMQQLEADYKSGIFKNYTPYTVSTTGNTLTHIDEALQFALFHESIHLGYILALIRALKN